MTAIRISEIILDARLQMRAKMDFEAIDEYAENASKLPPGKIVRGPKGEMWLTGGWHRYHAAVKAGIETLTCEVRDGTFQEALIEAAGENADHGIKRTPKDKRRAVEAILKDKDLAKRSNRMIAEICRVGEHLVADVRDSKSTARARSSKRVGADGKARPAQNAGPSTAAEAKKREKVASHACPELQQALADGKVNLTDAAAVAKELHGFQVLAIEKISAGEATTLVAAIKAIKEHKKATKGQSLCERCKFSGYQEGCGACAHIAEQANKKEPLVDDKGNDVPEELRVAFSIVPQFKKFNQTLTSLAKLSKEIEEWVGRNKKPLDPKRAFTKFHLVFKKARFELAGFRPTLVCQGCVGKNCQACRGDQWISVEEAQAAKKVEAE